MSETVLIQALRSESGGAKVVPATGKVEGFQSLRLAHNRIDRITGRTPEEGGLFFEEVEIPESAEGAAVVHVHAFALPGEASIPF